MRDLRVLALHGYHGSADILRRQMKPLAAKLSGIEFVHVDAPSLAQRDFGWWHTPARGWDRSRAWAVELFASQPRFDGVFGFSQGAAMTGLLAGLREAHRAQDGDGAGAIDFDFAVMVGGFKNDAPEHAEYYRPKFTAPSVHIVGRRDGVIPPHESQDLADQFVDPIVLTHSGGHIVPDTCEVVGGLAGFLDRMRANHRVETTP
jgi:pimeloyl-ACP methyl ester carboxylesterase